jgi:hypothetical protein
MSKSFVFIQHLKSTKEPKISSLVFDGHVDAKLHVQRLLESSVDVESVEMYESVAHARKVTETVWN